MFIHVATGCFIHQDGTYHSRIGGGEKPCSLAAALQIDEFKKKIKSLIGIPKKCIVMFQKRQKIEERQTCLRVTNDFDLLYC